MLLSALQVVETGRGHGEHRGGDISREILGRFGEHPKNF
jgi:hypothetical protein